MTNRFSSPCCIRCLLSFVGLLFPAVAFAADVPARLASEGTPLGYPRIKELTDGDVQRMPFDLVEIAATLAPRPFLTVAPLRDDNFPVKGLTDAQHALTPLYKLHAAEDHLTFDFPDAEHTFPPASREKTYAWLDRWLKPNEVRPSATGT